jgi:hypothetical protein
MSWIVQPVQAPTRRSWNIAGIVNKQNKITIGLDVHHRQPMGESSKYCVWNLKRTAVNVNGYHPWFFFRTVQIISRLLPLGHGVRNMNFANRVGYMVTRAISTIITNTVALHHDIQWCSGPRSVIIASYCCCVHVYTIRNLRWHTLTRGILIVSYVIGSKPWLRLTLSLSLELCVTHLWNRKPKLFDVVLYRRYWDGEILLMLIQ